MIISGDVGGICSTPHSPLESYKTLHWSFLLFSLLIYLLLLWINLLTWLFIPDMLMRHISSSPSWFKSLWISVSSPSEIEFLKEIFLIWDVLMSRSCHHPGGHCDLTTIILCSSCFPDWDIYLRTSDGIISLFRGHSNASSVLCLLESLGFSAHFLGAPPDSCSWSKNCSFTFWFQPPKVLPHCSIAVFPSLPSKNVHFLSACLSIRTLS